MSMKVIILHGTNNNPEDYWYRWLGKKLVTRGYTVEIPHYPAINLEPIDTFLPKVLAAHTFDNNTILIGHSAGAPLILSILEKVEATLQQVILVAGFARLRPEDDGHQDIIIQDSYDWERIKAHAQEFVFINSTDDPWGCNDIQGRFMYDKLGGTQVIRTDGHFGSTLYIYIYIYILICKYSL